MDNKNNGYFSPANFDVFRCASISRSGSVTHSVTVSQCHVMKLGSQISSISHFSSQTAGRRQQTGCRQQAGDSRHQAEESRQQATESRQQTSGRRE